MKADPTKKIRMEAAKKSRSQKDTKVFISEIVEGKKYSLSLVWRKDTILVYKNGNEIAL